MNGDTTARTSMPMNPNMPMSNMPMNPSVAMARSALWPQEIWMRIDKAVAEEMGSVRIAQRVFPTVMMMGAQTVVDQPINVGLGQPLFMQEVATKIFVELFAEFVMTPNQVMLEETVPVCEVLARLSAKAIAEAEDRILFRGQSLLPDGPRGPLTQLNDLGVQVLSKDSIPIGLLNENTKALVLTGDGTTTTPNVNDFVTVITNPTDPQQPFPESIFRGVTQGIARLHRKAQNEPIGLVLETSIFGFAHAPTEASLVMPADRIKPLVMGGFYESEALYSASPNPGVVDGDHIQGLGLLAALAGRSTTIYVSQDAITIPTQVDTEGNQHFRVVERVQYVCNDTRSLLRMEFLPRPA
jgi:hypothetical protein